MARKGKSFFTGLLSDNAPKSPYQRSAVDQGFEPAREWDLQTLPSFPDLLSPDVARHQIENSFTVVDPMQQPIRFNDEIFDHWKKEKGYSEDNIKGRLERLNMARQAVQNPREIWDQGTQRAYVQLFLKKTGGRKGCVVFVQNNNVVITYFPKNLGELEKVRKGILIGKSEGSA